MLYPVRDFPRRQHQAPTILASMTGRTYSQSATVIKMYLNLPKIKCISSSDFRTVLERYGFHVVRQYAEFDGTVSQWIKARPDEIKNNRYVLVTDSFFFLVEGSKGLNGHMKLPDHISRIPSTRSKLKQVWQVSDHVSEVTPEVPLVLEREAERSLSADHAQKMKTGRDVRKATYAMLTAALRPEGFSILHGKPNRGIVRFTSKQIIAPHSTTPASFAINVYLFFLVRHQDLDPILRRKAAWDETISFLDQNDIRFPAILAHKVFNAYGVE